jgi:hypothetical protein
MMENAEAYEKLNSLGNYLKTEMTISSGNLMHKVNGYQYGRLVEKETQGHNIKVTISNTAPVVTNWPAIVFTGVGLVVNHPYNGHINFKNMKDKENLCVDLANAPQSDPFFIKGSERINGADYPTITSDEERQGYVLFPGCSVTYKMKLTVKQCPDINKLKFWVEANISRRHLLHFRKELNAYVG